MAELRLSAETEHLISLGYTRAEKTLAESYAEGHAVAFHRVCKHLGAGKGDELRVAGTDPKTETATLEKADGSTVAWTRNDHGLGCVNSRNVEVAGVKDPYGDAPAGGRAHPHPTPG